MVMALKPICDTLVINKIICSTYQSVSGTGKEAIDELKQQIEVITLKKDFKINAYPYQIAFNILQHIDSFEKNGYNSKELKILNETKKFYMRIT